MLSEWHEFGLWVEVAGILFVQPVMTLRTPFCVACRSVQMLSLRVRPYGCTVAEDLLSYCRVCGGEDFFVLAPCPNSCLLALSLFLSPLCCCRQHRWLLWCWEDGTCIFALSTAFDFVDREQLSVGIKSSHSIKIWKSASSAASKGFRGIQGQKIQTQMIIHGFPQGGVLSPILFNIQDS